jgi:hypothetical protein
VGAVAEKRMPSKGGASLIEDIQTLVKLCDVEQLIYLSVPDNQ